MWMAECHFASGLHAAANRGAVCAARSSRSTNLFDQLRFAAEEAEPHPPASTSLAKTMSARTLRPHPVVLRKRRAISCSHAPSSASAAVSLRDSSSSSTSARARSGSCALLHRERLLLLDFLYSHGFSQRVLRSLTASLQLPLHPFSTSSSSMIVIRLSLRWMTAPRLPLLKSYSSLIPPRRDSLHELKLRRSAFALCASTITLPMRIHPQCHAALLTLTVWIFYFQLHSIT